MRTMARLGVLRVGDLRCLSATFMVVIFFCCVVLLTLQPSHYPTKLSMVDLPKDEVFRAEPIPALVPITGQNSNLQLLQQNGKSASGSGKEGRKKDGKLDKKALKAQWIQDELPKKLFIGRVRNTTWISSKRNVSRGVKDVIIHKDSISHMKNLTDAESSSASPVKAESQLEKNISESSGDEESPSSLDSSPKSSPKRQDESSEPKPQHNSDTEPALKSLKAKPVVNIRNAAAERGEDTPSRDAAEGKGPLYPNFPNLSYAPVFGFLSPFIENRSREEVVVVERKKRKIITWYRAADVEQQNELNRLKKALEGCPEPQCKLQYPLPDGVVADAVVFEDVFYNGEEESPVPDRKHRDQVYILRTMRPPLSPTTGSSIGQWKSAFNWTWSYRKESDIWQPFGLLKRAKKVRPVDYFEVLSKMKSKAVAWIPQTCPLESTQSRRSEFLQELSKHVHVSEFGPCLNKTCSSKADEASCSDALTKKFFFLLALEDDLCEDHVTEVFYRAWQAKTHVLPVVRGGADYAAYFPDGTYIDTEWFDSPKQLAEFMVELVASRKIYSQLLWRKAHWVRSSKRPDEVSLCKICHILHDLPSNQKWYSDIQIWYEDSVCKEPKPV